MSRLPLLLFVLPLALAQTPREPDVIFFPTPPEVVDRMLKIADIRPGEVVYDLGCGDGRICIAAAKKYKVKSWGFDIHPDRVKESRKNVQDAGVQDLVTIEQKDIFQLDLQKADVIMLYLLPTLNAKLIPQLDKLKPGARIVSHDFGMAGVRPKREETWAPESGREHKIFLWVTPLEKELQKDIPKP